MPEHALGSEDHERFAPWPQGLAAEQMKILGRVRRLANLNVVFRGQLQETFDASAGVFRPLALVAMGQQHHQTGEQVPFGFAGADKLVDDGLGNIHKVSELGLHKTRASG